MHDFLPYNSLSFNHDKIVNKHDIVQALAEYDILKAPNYAIIAKKYYLKRFTLSWRYRGKTTSKEHFES